MKPKKVPEEVIVVEGKADRLRLVETFGPQIKVIETKGSAIDEAILEEIKHAQETFGVIVLTDPDYPGIRIRRMIEEAIPTVQHAHLKQADTQAKKKGASLGIEHAHPEAIRQALEEVMTIKEGKEVEAIPTATLVRLKLVAHPQARAIREQIAQHFHLGYVNGKQLQKRLQQYGVTLDALLEALKEVEDHA